MPRTISSIPKKRGRPPKPKAGEEQFNGNVIAAETREEKVILREVTEAFDVLREFAHGIAKGEIQSLIASGSPGIGKTYTLDQVIKHYHEKGTVKKFTAVKGFMTAVMLYRLLYEHREKGQIVFLDDCDSIFWNEDALNILKAALDTVEHRIVSYRAMGDDDDIPSEFEFKGTMVFATNIDFYHYIKTAKNRVVEHIKALMSRVQYLPLKLHHPRAVVLWVSHMIRNNKMLQAHPHSLTAKQSEEVLTFLLENVDRIEPMVSLRTAVKCAEIVRMKGEGWQRLASFTILKG